VTEQTLLDGNLDRGNARAGQPYSFGCALGEVEISAIDLWSPAVDGDHSGVIAVAHPNCVPNGRVLWAAVYPCGSKGSPLAVGLPSCP
jgi:hypothetical protein